MGAIRPVWYTMTFSMGRDLYQIQQNQSVAKDTNLLRRVVFIENLTKADEKLTLEMQGLLLGGGHLPTKLGKMMLMLTNVGQNLEESWSKLALNIIF